ncbi:hypothetical protein MKX47_11825 [Solibacillus sp. FSL R7-0668]|uniref:hypothetical protein n=1 Tax=Solibacillus sp. FSL R7-0668 TaxID=2921688 RepID=UPI0030FAF1CD
MKTVAFKITGVPAISYPQLGDEMSNGAIITTDNQKEYFTAFERYENECSLLGLDVASVEIFTNNIAETEMIITDENAQELSKLSSVTISDHITGELYDAQIVGVI